MGAVVFSRSAQIKIYTFLLVLYYILTMLYPNNDNPGEQLAERIYPQIIMGILGLFSLYLTLKNANSLIKSTLCKPFLLYLILSFIYIFFPITNKTIYDNFIYFLKLDMAILTIGCLYSFLKVNRELTLKCIYIIYFVQLFYGLESLIVDRLGSLSEQNEIFNSNAGFSLISTLPMTLLLPIKRLRIYLYLLVVAACLASGQRSAALAAIISIPFSYRDIRDGIRKNDKVLITILLAIALVPIATFAYMNIMLRNAIDAEKGDIGSGRSVFWLLLIIDFFDKNVFHMIFGNGYFSTQALLKIKYGMGIEAHNGWLQNLYVFGFIGFIFYARTVFIMYKQNKFYNKIQNGVKNILLICFIIFFVKSSTSHGNWDISVMPFSLVIAMVADQIRIIKRASKSNDSNKNQSCITA